MSPAEVRAWLERFGLAARRDLGQNFLVDEALAAKLVRSAGVEPGDAVIEIGTGLGILTRALADVARQVRSIEVDAGLVRALRSDAGLPAHVELIHADALALDLAALVAAEAPPVRVVANLPYAVASPLLRRLLDLRHGLVDWSVMVQREVAERLRAPTDSPDYGSLAVLHQAVARVERLQDLHPRCFHPPPKVTSSFVRITPHRGAPVCDAVFESLERLVRSAFAHRRKTLRNSLRAAGGMRGVAVDAAWLEGQGVDPGCRAQQLPPQRWLALARTLAAG